MRTALDVDTAGRIYATTIGGALATITLQDLQKIQDELDEIGKALGGDGGVRVRLATAEQRLGAIEVSLGEHRKKSEEHHTATQTTLAKLEAKQSGGWQLDATSVRHLLGLAVALAGAAGLGVAGGAAAVPPAPRAPAPVEAVAPAPAATPAPAPAR